MALSSSRYASKAETAAYFQVSESTIENWHERDYITAYRVGPGPLLYNLEEIEAKLRVTPRRIMRDGRRRQKGRIVVLALPSEGDQ